MTDTSALAQSEQRLLQTNKENWTYAAGQATLLGHWSLHHAQAIARRQIEAARETATALSTLAPQFLVPKTVDALFEYADDSAQRWILFLDTLCQRGEAVIAREKRPSRRSWRSTTTRSSTAASSNGRSITRWCAFIRPRA